MTRLALRRETLFALLVFGAVCHAQAPTQQELETWVGPTPKARPPPIYPQRAVQELREGWVEVSFIVSKAGDVVEPMIEDSSGNSDLEYAALSAVQRWSFTPGTRNGEPADHSMNHTIIRFQIQGADGTSRQFAAKYKEIEKLVMTGDLPKAQQLLTVLGNEERRNLYEDAWYWWLRYTVLAATKTASPEELLTCLSAAVGYELDFLPADMFVAATSRMLLLRVQTGDLGGALDALERLKKSKTAKQSKDYQRVLDLLDPTLQRVEERIASEAILTNDAHIGTHDYYVHTLVRRSFGLSDIEGDLQALEVRCSHHNIRYAPVTDQHTWTVPASWEKCGVYVHGARGAKFRFYEYPEHG